MASEQLPAAGPSVPGSDDASPVATLAESPESTSEDELLAGPLELVPEGVTGGTAGLGVPGVTGFGGTGFGVTGFGVTGFEPGVTGFEVVFDELGVTLGTLPVGRLVEQSTEHVASLERDAEHAGTAPNHPSPIAMTFFTAIPLYAAFAQCAELQCGNSFHRSTSPGERVGRAPEPTSSPELYTRTVDERAIAACWRDRWRARRLDPTRSRAPCGRG